jgi:hypothetical protein
MKKADYHPPRLHGSAAMHAHCHHKAIISGAEHEEELLKKMGLKVQVLADGCCGMAGAFGFEEDHYDISAKIGEHGILPAVRRSGLSEMIISDGFSCREQIAQMSERRGLHIAEVLQIAIRQGPARAHEMLPEAELVEEHRKAIGKSKMEALAMLGGALAVTAGALGASRILKTNGAHSDKS